MLGGPAWRQQLLRTRFRSHQLATARALHDIRTLAELDSLFTKAASKGSTARNQANRTLIDSIVPLLQQPQQLACGLAVALGQVAPSRFGLATGIGTSSLKNAAVAVTGADEPMATAAFRLHADARASFEMVSKETNWAPNPSATGLSILELRSLLLELALDEGKEKQRRSQERIVDALMRCASLDEAGTLLKVLQCSGSGIRTLLTGVGVAGMLRALAEAVVSVDSSSISMSKSERTRAVTAVRQKLETAYRTRPDLAHVVRLIADRADSGLEIPPPRLGIPLLPMLPHAARAEALRTELPGMGTVEVQGKYDGMRVQVHFSRDARELWPASEVRFWSTLERAGAASVGHGVSIAAARAVEQAAAERRRVCGVRAFSRSGESLHLASSLLAPIVEAAADAPFPHPGGAMKEPSQRTAAPGGDVNEGPPSSLEEAAAAALQGIDAVETEDLEAPALPGVERGVWSAVLDCELVAVQTQPVRRVLPFSDSIFFRRKLQQPEGGAADGTQAALAGDAMSSAPPCPRGALTAEEAVDVWMLRDGDDKGSGGGAEASSTRVRAGEEDAEEERLPMLVAFDLLSLNGLSLLSTPYEARLSMLESAFRGVRDSFTIARGVRVAPDSEAVDNLLTPLLQRAAAEGMEGLMVKSLQSSYQPGARSKQWLKYKVEALEASDRAAALGSGSATEARPAPLFGDTAAAAGEADAQRWATRSWEWPALPDHLDLVPIGAYLGKGALAGQYSSLLLASALSSSELASLQSEEVPNTDAVDAESQSTMWQTVTRVSVHGKMPEQLRELIAEEGVEQVGKPDVQTLEAIGAATWKPPAAIPQGVCVLKAMAPPDVWIPPAVVVEIAGQRLSSSARHSCLFSVFKAGNGVSVRFPTLERVRTDKSPASSTPATQLAGWIVRASM